MKDRGIDLGLAIEKLMAESDMSNIEVIGFYELLKRAVMMRMEKE